MVATWEDLRSLRVDDPMRLLTAVLDALPLSLYVVDRRLKVVAWNRYRETGPLGRPRHQVLGRPLEDVLSPQGFQAVLPSLERVFDTGVALVTDKPASGVESIDTKTGMDKCWG